MYSGGTPIRITTSAACDVNVEREERAACAFPVGQAASGLFGVAWNDQI